MTLLDASPHTAFHRRTEHVTDRPIEPAVHDAEAVCGADHRLRFAGIEYIGLYLRASPSPVSHTPAPKKCFVVSNARQSGSAII